ncbi:HypC/HybG/HupF family hydrogenase formation chaperone [candidate division KSB1 bacterium]
MCLAIPGKVIEVKGEDVIVEYPGEKRDVKDVGLGVKKGDYVIVQAKIVVQKVPEQDALESLKAWEDASQAQ